IAAGAASSTEAQDPTSKKLIVEFLNDVCCAMLIMLKRPLLEADFSMALKQLQAAGQGLDIQRILIKAQEIRAIRRAHSGVVQKEPPPPPLTAKEHRDFTQPQPRPGEEMKASLHGLHIAMLNAVPAERVPPPTRPSPALSDDVSLGPASSSTTSLSATVGLALAGAADSANQLAGNVAKLVSTSAAAAKPLVRDAVSKAKDAGTKAKDAVEHAVQSAATLAANAITTPNEARSIQMQVDAATATTEAEIERASSEDSQSPDQEQQEQEHGAR
ncbi:MAG: hypothetical protein P4L81_08160, partial [Candidatus Pacebacteria bacterium]|nr:hypothetical protein [Candidatus Paceibacterota bacterium]